MNINDFIERPANAATYAVNSVPKFVLEASDKVTAVLKLGGVVLYSASYQPDFNDMVSIDLGDLYAEYVNTALPGAGTMQQLDHRRQFQALLTQGSDSLSFNYYVANSRLRSSTSFQQWVATHFLTNQPAEKHVVAGSPEWLTFMCLSGGYSLKARVYTKTGSVDVSVVGSTQGVATVDVSPSAIRRLAPTASEPLNYYDIRLLSGSTLKATQRYVIDRSTGQERHFVFVNSLGGIDTLTCQGSNMLQQEMNFNTGVMDARRVAIDDSDNHRMWSQSLRFPWRQRQWVYGLLTARSMAAVYNPATGLLDEIVITDLKMGVSDNGQLATATFNYVMADTDDTVAETEREWV